MLKTGLSVAAAVLFSLDVQAAGHEIRMVTTEAGEMRFDPDFVEAAPGDTIRFIPVGSTHNAETLKGMIPDGAVPFKGEISEDFTITLNEEGVYGIVCKSHYAVGMVMTVLVGEPVNLEQAMKRPHPLKAKAVFRRHFDAILSR